MILLFQITNWISILGPLVAAALVLAAALPWRSVANARKEKLEDAEKTIEQKDQEILAHNATIAERDVTIALLNKDIEIYKAKTNFTEFRKTVEAMFDKQREFIVTSETMILAEFKKHADQDAQSAEQTLKTLTALASREEARASN